MPPRAKRIAIPLFICLAGLAVLSVHTAYYWPFISDDALISMRYADRLLDGKGLTWNDGERVEGYSNFLWLLSAAGLGALGMDLIVALRVMGFLGMGAVIFALTYAQREPLRWSWAATAFAVAAWALSGSVAAWVRGGLEAPMLAALLAWALVLGAGAHEKRRATLRGLWLPGLLFGLLALVRPDGILFAVLFAGWLLLAGRFGADAFKRAALLIALPLVLLGAHVAFRLAYYGEWVPNTAYVKISPTWPHLKSGLLYVAGGVASLRPLGEFSLVALLVLLRDRARRHLAFLLLAIVLVWCAYIAFIGGDIFPGWRHMIPLVVVMALAIGLAVDAFTASRYYKHGRLLPALPLLIWFVATQFSNQDMKWAKRETWVWNSKIVGELLNEGFAGREPTIAITAAGGIPYWSKLPSLDLLGLNDRHIARSRPPGHAERWIGHNVGDIDYVLARRPDMMHFGTAGGEMPKFAYETLVDEPLFKTNYTLCKFSVREPQVFTASIYVDRESKRIGLRQSADELYVPPYLLNAVELAYTHLDTDKRFYITVNPERVMGVRRLTSTSGRWQLIEPDAQGLRVVVIEGKNVVMPEMAGGVSYYDLNGSDNCGIFMETTTPDPVRVRGLRLVRLTGGR